MISTRALGLLVGFAADRLWADPQRLHPVAGFGTAAAALERSTYRDTRAAGVLHVGLLVGGAVGTGWLAHRAAGRSPTADALAVSASTWAVCGGTSLARVGGQMADRLDAGDLEAARALLPSLCGRDASVLDSDGLARAALESIAENTADATVAALFWGGLAGAPGLLGYRAVNTLDAMVGHRSPRYANFGWAAARLDDVANYLPARATAALTVVLAPLVGGRPADARRAWRRDAAAHPSPNAGPVEASMAGALGVMLGGRTEYMYGVQERPRLGDGPAPTATDLRRAVRMSVAVQTASAVGSAFLAVALRQGGLLLRRQLGLLRR
ncbi:cobalamin biosynthesis protein [Tomitella biformata]|uniref:cobalamin biosynthesis protein n=1 Tax=Tomitella biformata TaxID=630403 RepID=UPI000465B554|nr:cobalamin biosynthesis protein [Tomitella biformata]